MFKMFINKNQIKNTDAEIFVTASTQNQKKCENKSDALPQSELILLNRLMIFYLIGLVPTAALLGI